MGRRMGKKGGCHRLRVTRRTFNFPVGFSKTSSLLRECSSTIEGVATKRATGGWATAWNRKNEGGWRRGTVVKWVIGSRVKAKLDIPRKIISARMTMIEFSRIIRPSHLWWEIREWMRCNVALMLGA